MAFLVVKFNIHSLIDIYGSVKKISPAAKNQMMLDALNVLDSSKRLLKVDFRVLEDYITKYFSLVQYDEMLALAGVANNIRNYSLRILKGFYLYSSKEMNVKKFFSTSNLVVKTEKLMTIFELSRSCLLSLVEDRKFIAQEDCSQVLIDILLAGVEAARNKITLDG